MYANFFIFSIGWPHTLLCIYVESEAIHPWLPPNEEVVEIMALMTSNLCALTVGAVTICLKFDRILILAIRKLRNCLYFIVWYITRLFFIVCQIWSHKGKCFSAIWDSIPSAFLNNCLPIENFSLLYSASCRQADLTKLNFLCFWPCYHLQTKEMIFCYLYWPGPYVFEPLKMTWSLMVTNILRTRCHFLCV